MRLENIVIDAQDPIRLGGFWAAALGARPITEESDLFEAQLVLPGVDWLDLCFPRVPDPVQPDPRLHLDLSGGAHQRQVIDRLLGLGARHLDIGQGSVPWVVLADPEGNPCCVMEDRPEYADTGAIAALPLDSADPERDLEFWALLTGWRRTPGSVPHTLRHPSGRGPLLELCPEPTAKTTKNRIHLDLRFDTGDDPARWAERLIGSGGRPMEHDWGELPWQVWQDPSGNEFCLLAASERVSPSAAG
ncbi:VOC family protein [Naumannella sp. ID2617S]|nr:VOC family protein [Naumannella sp. ID2617S]